MPETTRLSSKGQVVLPGSIRHAHRWQPGTEFVVEDTAEGILLKPVASARATSIDEVAGCLKPRGPRVGLDEIDAAIAREAQARHARGRY
ncbi:MAG: AbrB/MazE/SpoVT family DNA-binding domain-containing protein [Acidovorax sp.]|uniref:AbrB/MazE/SpoVT family DNA-binding domain-containing protein n=1 Tax=Acidovorax sp. TaxID=1872122 RepID=UPI0039E41EED